MIATLAILGSIAAVGALWLWAARRRDRKYLREYEKLELAASAEERADSAEPARVLTVEQQKIARMGGTAVNALLRDRIGVDFSELVEALNASGDW